MRKFGKIILWALAIIGGFNVAVIMAITAFTMAVHDKPPSLPDIAILHIDLDTPLEERLATHPLFKPVPPATLLETLTAIDRAAASPNIKALSVTMGQTPLSFAWAQEFENAIRRFRKSGKKAFLYSYNLAPLGDGTPEVMLASAFDEVWVAPSAMIGLTGVSLEIPYFAEGLDELGVTAEFEQRHEYKGGADPFMRSKISPLIQESLQGLTNGLLDQAVTRIARNRSLKVQDVLNLVHQGPFLPQEARSLGLIDRIGYLQEFHNSLYADLPEITQTIDAEFLLAATGGLVGDDPKAARIAVLYGIGEIGNAQHNSPFGDPGFDAVGLLNTIENIADTKEFDAVLFRVDSPGGAYSPSDEVWKALSDLEAGGIPVIVSMGDIAASGGYFVSAASKNIVANPGTITGSIGVYGGKFDASRLWEKLGIHWHQIAAGDNAGMWSVNRGLDVKERGRLAAMMDFVYDDFTSKVAVSRNFNHAQIDAAARGRIWLGEDALRIGLVDHLGGFHKARSVIREILSLPGDAPLSLVVLPEPREAWEIIAEALDSGEFAIAVRHLIAGAVEDRVQQRAEMILGDLTFLEPPQGLLAMPVFKIR